MLFNLRFSFVHQAYISFWMKYYESTVTFFLTFSLHFVIEFYFFDRSDPRAIENQLYHSKWIGKQLKKEYMYTIIGSVCLLVSQLVCQWTGMSEFPKKADKLPCFYRSTAFNFITNQHVLVFFSKIKCLNDCLVCASKININVFKQYDVQGFPKKTSDC